jgi:hypothetical protein
MELNTLLTAAGIIEKSNDSEKSDSSEWEKRIAFYTGEMSEDQREKVLDYIKFLKFKN